MRRRGGGAARVPPPERCRAGVGNLMAANPQEPEGGLDVVIAPMERRHLKSVLRIEGEVFPRPWSMSLFLSELALRATRAYYVARAGRHVVGYGGVMMSDTDGHITTIAVDP